jgi:hypothetical protein
VSTLSTVTIREDAMSDDDVHRVELRARTAEELRSLLDGSDVDLGCRPTVRRQPSGELTTEV